MQLLDKCKHFYVYVWLSGNIKLFLALKLETRFRERGECK